MAIQAGRDYRRVTNGNPTFELLTLLRFGRFDEILEITSRPSGEIPGSYWDFAQGYARLRQGDVEGAIAAFRRAAGLDDEQPYDEPEPIPYGARHWLGAMLLEAGRHAEAEREYSTELENHPHNVWSLTGLKAALDAQGKTDPAVDGDLENSTARVDLWIPGSHF